MATETDFSSIMARLADTGRPVPMASLYHLSDLKREDQAAFEALWHTMAAERRLHILQNLHEIAEANFEVVFENVFRLGLDDESPEVRALAIKSLWESEDETLIAPLLETLQHDPDGLVRASAASALGRFVYLGELEEIPAVSARKVEDALLDVIMGEDELEVRRRALEAVAYANRPEVEGLIDEAYESPEDSLRLSAVFAMGRSADDERWSDIVRAELENSDPEMRFEAARAAGELELQLAGPELADLATDVDTQVREAAIWSLGQIGGDFARQTLTALLEAAEDEDDQEFIEEALANLDYTDEIQSFALFDIGPGGNALDLGDLDDEIDEDLE
ncbi:MAG: HEAT repeat domain-containing protein [Burkholderiaceae bacterium]